MSQRTKST
ncbi:hypothetical protein F383_34375 [Gossypium arboreum]|uniref:Uncharacterized protein n=1 Tax=Gossypium arboreum TaxID=29729 RepID=A0A0B0PV22_GOSAR|nr:hypothetical protein F383_34375 [Gossypium arboreum]